MIKCQHRAVIGAHRLLLLGLMWRGPRANILTATLNSLEFNTRQVLDAERIASSSRTVIAAACVAPNVRKPPTGVDDLAHNPSKKVMLRSM